MSMNWLRGAAEGVTAGVQSYQNAQKLAMARELLGMKIQKYKQEQAYKTNQAEKLKTFFSNPENIKLSPRDFMAELIRFGIDPKNIKAMNAWMGPQASINNLKLASARTMNDENADPAARERARNMFLYLSGKLTVPERKQIKAAPTDRMVQGGGGPSAAESKAKWNAAVRRAAEDARGAQRALHDAQNWISYYRLNNKPDAAAFYERQLPELQRRVSTARDYHYRILNQGYSSGGTYGPPTLPAPTSPPGGSWGERVPLPGISNQGGALPPGQRPYVPGQPPPFINTVPNYRVIRRAN